METSSKLHYSCLAPYEVTGLDETEPSELSESGRPNYGQVYIYLSSLLKGESPPLLPPLESSVVLTLIQDIINKIRTSDLSGQMHYFSNWYRQYQSENDSSETNELSAQSKSNVSPTQGTVKRTSSGRIVRHRVDLTQYNDDEDDDEQDDEEEDDEEEDDEEDEEKEENDSQQKSEIDPPTKRRPTSLNPFRIPVNLLNFKERRITFVADKPNSLAPS